MKTSTLLIAPAVALFLLGTAASAPAQDVKPLTMARARTLVPRPGIEPVKSLIPQPDVVSVDTLDTNDPRIKLVLRSNNTWEYVKDQELLEESPVFKDNWSHDVINPYKVAYEDLPLRNVLWLVDSASTFCVPYQTRVHSRFGWRRTRQHMGVDLPYPMGTPVKAAFPGKVRYARRSGGYGNLVIIRHENGMETYYGHLSRIDVAQDDWVEAGQVIALGGSTGRSTGPHLHFETRYMGYAFDPQWLIDFETGTLKHGVFMLKRKYLSPGATYVPESEEESDEIYLTEEEERLEEERLARERAAARYHKIRSGDTLSGLAAKYHTTVSAICKLNGITARTTLRVGRTIRVK